MKGTVLIIGGGLAGMSAGLAAAGEGSRVLIVDRGSLGLGTNSALANGVFATVSDGYPAEAYIADTLAIGRMINHRPYVERVSRETAAIPSFLRSLGLQVAEGSSQCVVRAQPDGIIPGLTLVKAFAGALGSSAAIEVLGEFTVTAIVEKDGRAAGVEGIDRQGRPCFLKTSAVVLATGGGAAIYRKNDNQRLAMGQGMLLAAEAGLSLRDMEFVQFYPLCLDERGFPAMIVYPSYPDEVRLLNGNGEDLLRKFGVTNLNEAALKNRDSFSVALAEEGERGGVFIDFRGVPQERWTYHPMSILAKLKGTLKERPVKVSPAAHFFMGGIPIDDQGRTGIEGLFACGEIVWGLHGANRRGGNALTECFVSGRIAGRTAGEYAIQTGAQRAHIEPLKCSEDPGSGEDDGKLRDLAGRLREAAWRYAGVVRSREGMAEGLVAAEGLRAEIRATRPSSAGKRLLKFDLTSGVLVLTAILRAGLGREESRGAFQRSDFPQEDNKHWRKNSCVSYDRKSDGFSVTYMESEE
jgi:succinate dehydrogenase/fumarate reductase flavoprotein subunit